MESSARSFFLTLSLIPLISYSLSQANANEPSTKLIEEVCKEAIDNGFCLKVLKTDRSTSKAKTNCGLAKSALKLMKKKAEETQDFLKELLKKDKSEDLQFCAISCYDSVVNSYQIALRDLPFDGLAANYDATVAGDGAHNCEDRLVSAGIHNPEVSSRNHETMSCSNVAYAATYPLQGPCAGQL